MRNLECYSFAAFNDMNFSLIINAIFIYISGYFYSGFLNSLFWWLKVDISFQTGIFSLAKQIFVSNSKNLNFYFNAFKYVKLESIFTDNLNNLESSGKS